MADLPTNGNGRRRDTAVIAAWVAVVVSITIAAGSVGERFFGTEKESAIQIADVRREVAEVQGDNKNQDTELKSVVRIFEERISRSERDIQTLKSDDAINRSDLGKQLAEINRDIRGLAGDVRSLKEWAERDRAPQPARGRQ